MDKPYKPNAERPNGIFHLRSNPLDVFFKPESVAVIGATENPGSVGRTLLWNLISTPFGGTVYPVNPKRASVLGIKAYPSIADVPEVVDLVVVITPAKTVPGVIRECVQAGVKGAIVISAGFKELGPQGAALEQQVLEEARKGNMRIVGPNCLGVMCPVSGVNATFAPAMALTGNVGFISQSGALCTSVLDWSLSAQVGFSAFVSVGSMADVGWGDLINYLGDDPRTSSIVIYMESIGDARSFLSAAREVALTKPIIVIKAGRTAAAAKAAASHTGSMTGSDAVLEAAFRRCGVLRVNEISDLFNMATILARQPRPKGPKLTVITNAGGPGVLATDELITSGGELAPITEETINKLNEFLPGPWSHGNPIDVLGDALPDRYAKSVEIAANDPNTDGLLVILTPQSMTDATGTAEQLRPYSHLPNKPILASWIGGPLVAHGAELLTRQGIPNFAYPDAAARAFNYMWKYSYNLNGLYQTPESNEIAGEGAPDREEAAKIIERTRMDGRTILTEFESKELLASYGIPIVKTIVAADEDVAVKAAEEIGYPVVLKLFSETITHKTDVGGVKLNLLDEDGVRRAFSAIKTSVTEKAGAEHFQGVTVQKMVKLEGYEIILGASVDPQFGPVLLFGSGGQLVEVYKDSSLALPPLNTTLARRMMEQTKIYKALQGVRGRKPCDLDLLDQILVRFSQLVVEQRWIKEIDINPILASADAIIALDARVVVYDKDTPEEKLPKLAIRPYPIQYIKDWTMPDGAVATIRPIRASDEPLLVKFHENLSETTVYKRYLHVIKLSQRVAHERLTRICFNDYDREIALVADYRHHETGEHMVLGVARMSKIHGTEDAEFSIVVEDEYQCCGMGTEMLSRLIQIAKDEKIQRLTATILMDNLPMQKVCKKLGFTIEHTPGEETVNAFLNL